MTINCKTPSANLLIASRAMPKAIPVLFIAFTAIISFIIHATAPSPSIKADTETAISVNVMQVDKGAFTPSYTAYGTVIAKNTLTLTAQVDGQLSYLANNLIEGGILNIGDSAFQQDPADLQAVLSQRQAEVEIASAQLALELGEQRIAEKDYQMMLNDFNENQWSLNLELLLRKPQLSQAKAQLNIAHNSMNIAARDLKRSQWSSDKHYAVESRTVSQGDYLVKGDEIAKLIEINQLRVPIYLPREVASRVTTGQAISLYQPDTKRTVKAYVSHIFPMLDSKIQLQKVFAEYQADLKDPTSLIIGDFVEARFLFTPIENTLNVPLSAIDNHNIWLVSANNTLKRKPITILSQDQSSAVIHNVIADDEQLIISKMHSPQAGLNVRVVGGV
ncbi:efflux RND transporter periplasmic adaptor subunit [Shewanella eurypsychrophilus]|uniref:Efflux RND transporter periplasmic adaptor subunit n=1 Tax=Shewanella eurypsychrophilus TaxID=2593656 RepID=A0ABX6V6J6_9GAMM|nr:MULTISPECIES: HlyD family efflux transporter periplasmic adaptor subunit [Shewanella]QFU22184.1 HlyD family efflux transporter periplasmic adaptor subunit [Shewanella sp. YLB-09]QPG57471.1 efflux RND transporter periplasmic adaptor subunit [Shewanella eurypsychrophilus]